MLAAIATLTTRRPKAILAVVAVLAVAAGAFGHNVEHRLKAAGFTDSSSESERATGVMRQAFGYDPNPGLVVVLRPRGAGRLDLNDPRVRAEVMRLAGVLRRAPDIGRVINPLSDPSAKQFIARDGRSLIITGHLDTRDIEDAGGHTAEVAGRRLRSSLLRIQIGGFAPSFNEVNDQTRKDLTNAELIAFPALTILLLLVFRGVIAAAVPLLIGVLSILASFVMLRLMSMVVDTSLFALNITTALSLGLAVDYALLLVTRFREELARHGPGDTAVRNTVTTAGRAVLFSGLTVGAAMASLMVFPQRFLYSVGFAGAAVAVLSATVALLVVPSMLALLGTRIDSLAIRRGPSLSDDSGGWAAVARMVMRRPILVGLAASALLLGAASPLLSTVLTGPSAQAVPPSQPSFDANEYATHHYSRGLTEAITVAVRGPVTNAELTRFTRELEGVKGIASVGPFARAGDVAYANLAANHPALDRPTQDAVDDIRALPPPARASVLVSGNTARFMDQKQSMLDHLALVVALVAGSTIVLLFALTGSVLLPLKTLVMNGLTLAATLGILVLAFQHGWLDSPLSYEGPAAIEVTSLVFLFAVTFGLATDYAVLVIARIKEERDHGASNERAVAIGIGRTGRVISAAAIMIAVVFLAFGVSDVFFMKQIAIGAAVGVIIDATVVRALLVPALMRLLGEWNWWAPRPLRALQARIGLSES